VKDPVTSLTTDKASLMALITGAVTRDFGGTLWNFHCGHTKLYRRQIVSTRFDFDAVGYIGAGEIDYR
jgi:hypothetical protein